MSNRCIVLTDDQNGSKMPFLIADIKSYTRFGDVTTLFMRGKKPYFVRETEEQITAMIVGDLKCDLPEFMTAALHHAKGCVASFRHIFEFYMDEKEAAYPRQFALYRRIMPDRVKAVYWLLEAIQSGDKERIDLALENCKKAARDNESEGIDESTNNVDG